MLWKLAITLGVVFWIAGRTPALSNPLIRLLLPRSWAAVLSALPARRPTRPGPPAEPPKPWLDRRTKVALIVVLLLAIAAWLATRATISSQAVSIDEPRGTAR
ncbi:hypothetical protein [Tautonia sociabilis]|uniref:Uncharacterized protein n=1 Tax=Tautonia sociabilis TaxID=2080755 RepID=A0A432MPM3_9BACT|nr:hypothetical protein [Tautonia sociabilis]RUL89411.1 hypothetical protein TsocGM_01165 [Tautonia sociabilis]